MADFVEADVSELVAGYRRELAELRHNSKPIITSLTILADENQHAAPAIAACIAQHIRQAPPAHKLPALYLLDSICKNLRGVDYIAHFTPQIVNVFTSAYAQVPPPQQQALKHLFRTWTDCRIFDLEVLQSIDNELARIDADGPSSAALPLASGNPLRPPPTAPSLVALGHEIHVNPKHRDAPHPRPLPSAPPPIGSSPGPRPPLAPALGSDEQRLPVEHVFPKGGDGPRRRKKGGGGKRRRTGGPGRDDDRDRGPLGHGPPHWPVPGGGILQQEAQAGPPTELPPFYAEPPPPPVLSSLPAPRPAAPPPSAEAFQQAEQLLAALHSLLPPAPPSAPTPPLPPGLPPRSAPPLPNGPPPPSAVDLQQLTLLSSLLQAQGQPPPPRGPHPPPATAPPSFSSAAPPTPPLVPSPPPVGRMFVLEALRVRQEGVLSALYWAFPHQCKRCGRRFSERTQYSAHLDWHFQQNKRRREGKTASRPWFGPATDWGNGPDGEEEAGPEGQEGAEGESADAGRAEQESAAVPAEEGQSTCALCGEAFEVFWSAEDEEWMYRGAAYQQEDEGDVANGEGHGPIVHVKCWSDKDMQADERAVDVHEHADGRAAEKEGEGGSPSLRERATDGAGEMAGHGDGEGERGGERSSATSYGCQSKRGRSWDEEKSGGRGSQIMCPRVARAR